MLFKYYIKQIHFMSEAVFKLENTGSMELFKPWIGRCCQLYKGIPNLNGFYTDVIPHNIYSCIIIFIIFVLVLETLNDDLENDAEVSYLSLVC